MHTGISDCISIISDAGCRRGRPNKCDKQLFRTGLHTVPLQLSVCNPKRTRQQSTHSAVSDAAAAFKSIGWHNLQINGKIIMNAFDPGLGTDGQTDGS